MAPKSVTFRRHDHLVSVLFGDLLSHSYNITFSMFLYLVTNSFYWGVREDLDMLYACMYTTGFSKQTQFRYVCACIV